jgi:very-short-patch-repair endonuclease
MTIPCRFRHRSLLRDMPSRRELIQEAAETHSIQQRSPQTEQDLQNARSGAEAFLYRVLNEHPRTSGFFKLNEPENFLFGSRPMEIDLSCRTLRLAIEVDGYFHFVSEDSYRRDRRKDELLQKHGYLVLRFLANDVVPHLPEIVASIIEAIEWRRQSSSSTTLTNAGKPR